MKNISRFLALSLLIVAARSSAQNAAPDFAKVADSSVWRIQNRHAKLGDERGRKVVQLDAAANDGVAWIVGSNFSEGIIEVDLRGRNLPGQSFVGIALHGKEDDTAYEVIYFRPFNFANPDVSHRAHAVQYVSMPDFSWEKLRAENPGKYESTISPVPNPDDWFHARIVVEGRNISVFVNESPTPSLVVVELGERRRGLLGLWVGNGSDGAFSKLKVTPQKQ